LSKRDTPEWKEAKKLLVETEMTVAEVSKKTGIPYNNLYYHAKRIRGKINDPTDQSWDKPKKERKELHPVTTRKMTDEEKKRMEDRRKARNAKPTTVKSANAPSEKWVKEEKVKPIVSTEAKEAASKILEDLDVEFPEIIGEIDAPVAPPKSVRTVEANPVRKQSEITAVEREMPMSLPTTARSIYPKVTHSYDSVPVAASDKRMLELKDTPRKTSVTIRLDDVSTESLEREMKKLRGVMDSMGVKQVSVTLETA
jgi:hypothetical protein